MDSPFILIAEPDPVHADYLVKILSRLGYRTAVVDRGVDLILWITERRPSILMVELRLPDIRGPETIRIIHRVHPEIPVIGMIHDNSQKAEAEARETGLFYYLLKPFGVHEISASVGAALEHRRRMQDIRASPGEVPTQAGITS